MHGRAHILLGSLFLAMAGCAEDLPQSGETSPAAPARKANTFDVAQSGTVAGRAAWDGKLPSVPPFVSFNSPDNLPADGKMLSHEANPFRPLIDPDSKGVADAVVFLRGIDTSREYPWPHPPVHIEHQNRKLTVVQGDTTSRVGFVRRGDAIAALTRDGDYHALRARGAAFFTLPFVDKDRPTVRRLDQAGIVELSSAASYFWMHAYLFVVDHPYYARSDRDGHFRLDHVPPGQYEAVCWLPNWDVVRKERDPESGLVARIVFAPPIELAAPVTVQPGTIATMRYSLPGK